MQGREPYAAAHADRAAEFLYVRGVSEGAEQDDGVPHLLGGEPVRACAHGLEDEGDRSPDGIGVGDRERDALAEVLVDLDDDELAGLALPRHERGLDLDLEDFFR